jgi:hypothetical protein
VTEKLTETQKSNMLDLLALIGERDRPSENTEARLVERSGLDQESVAWCLSVLWNDGNGWLEWDDHPHTGERGYYLGEKFDKANGSLDKLYASFQAVPGKAPGAEGELDLGDDDEDPDDEWADIDDDDDPDYRWE